MKTLFLFSLAIVLSAVSALAQGAQGVIIKQRAKEVVNQSNVRQGVPTPAQPVRPASAAPATANPKLQNISLLQTDLAAIQGKPDASAALKQRFARNLLAASPGPVKPSGATVMTLVDNLAGLLPTSPLEAAERARLAQDLNALFDSANIPGTRVDAILADVQAILQVSGARRQAALSVVSDLRTTVAEIQKSPSR